MLEYNYQSEANISSLLEDLEYKERKEALLIILKEFKNNEVKYGVACSFNLFLLGITDEFHDFDFIVDIDSISSVKKVMKELGAKLVDSGGNGVCESDIYLHYQLGRVDIDIISGFQILTFGTSIHYKYNSDEINTLIIYEDEKIEIPLITVEALFLLYAMMEGWQPKRRYKRILIEKYLEDRSLEYPEIFREFLNSSLPGWIKREIRKLLVLTN